MIISLFMDTPDGGTERAWCVRVHDRRDDPSGQATREEHDKRERHQFRLVSSDPSGGQACVRRLAATNRIQLSS
jgi:hypothetical protein